MESTQQGNGEVSEGGEWRGGEEEVLAQLRCSSPRGGGEGGLYWGAGTRGGGEWRSECASAAMLARRGAQGGKCCARLVDRQTQAISRSRPTPYLLRNNYSVGTP